MTKKKEDKDPEKIDDTTFEGPVEKEFRFSGAAHRLEGENFEEYKARRTMLNAIQKQKLKGEILWPSHLLGKYLKGFKGKEEEIMQKLKDYAKNQANSNLDSDNNTES